MWEVVAMVLWADAVENLDSGARAIALEAAVAVALAAMAGATDERDELFSLFIGDSAGTAGGRRLGAG